MFDPADISHARPAATAGGSKKIRQIITIAVPLIGMIAMVVIGLKLLEARGTAWRESVMRELNQEVDAQWPAARLRTAAVDLAQRQMLQMTVNECASSLLVRADTDEILRAYRKDMTNPLARQCALVAVLYDNISMTAARMDMENLLARTKSVVDGSAKN